MSESDLAATIQGCLVFLNNDLRAIVAASHSDKRQTSAVLVWKALSIDAAARWLRDKTPIASCCLLHPIRSALSHQSDRRS
jgi:hypothetical protein